MTMILPGIKCLAHAVHRKHSKWKILDFALITKSFLLNELPHLSHFVPNNLESYAFISKRNNLLQIKSFIA